ncbi:MAG: TldD/PmbA family protein [Deltaproteobacteria bacterium]|nr:TldD/PmbA family protein [Deltaproteobacteria bacterium]
MQLEDLATEVLQQAKRLGVSAGDVIIATGESFSAGVRLGEVEKVLNAREKRLGLRLFVGHSSAITSTANFTRESLSALVEETVGLAKATAADEFSGLPAAKDLAQDFPDLDLSDSTPNLTPEDKIALAREAEAAALGMDPRITNSEGAEFSNGSHEVLYANSLGFVGRYYTTSYSLSVVPVASQGGAMQRDYWYSSHRKLNKLEPAAVVGRKAAERTVRRLGARQVKTQEVPVVFDPQMAASLLRHLAGAVSGSALYRKTSFLLGKLGEKIAATGISIDDDARIPSALGSKPFDGEGLPTRRTPVVKDGILTSYLLDTYSARKLGLRSTGNASQSFADAPAASPTNFFLKPGNTSPEEIIRSVGSGLYVTELSGFGVNPVTGDYSRGAVGLWIENGELAYPVEEITIAGNLLEMFQNIEVIGNDLELRGTIAAPTLKIARMTIAGE